jgi:hypothetical protein
MIVPLDVARPRVLLLPVGNEARLGDRFARRGA